MRQRQTCFFFPDNEMWSCSARKSLFLNLFLAQQLLDNAKPKACIVWVILENKQIALVVCSVAMSIIVYHRLKVTCDVFQYMLHELYHLPSKVTLCKVHVEVVVTIWKIRMVCLRLRQDAKYNLRKFLNLKSGFQKKLILFISMKAF